MVAADESTVSVAVTALPLIAGGEETVQVGAPVAPTGEELTTQLKATVPVKPPLGVTETVEVAETPATSDSGLPLRANCGEA